MQKKRTSKPPFVIYAQQLPNKVTSADLKTHFEYLMTTPPQPQLSDDCSGGHNYDASTTDDDNFCKFVKFIHEEEEGTVFYNKMPAQQHHLHHTRHPNQLHNEAAEAGPEPEHEMEAEADDEETRDFTDQDDSDNRIKLRMMRPDHPLADTDAAVAGAGDDADDSLAAFEISSPVSMADSHPLHERCTPVRRRGASGLHHTGDTLAAESAATNATEADSEVETEIEPETFEGDPEDHDAEWCGDNAEGNHDDEGIPAIESDVDATKSPETLQPATGNSGTRVALVEFSTADALNRVLAHRGTVAGDTPVYTLRGYTLTVR